MMFLTGSRAVSFTNDSTGVGSTDIIRSQLQSIADEVVDSAKFEFKERIAIIVEGEMPRTLAQNAFIGAFQKRNYISVVTDTAFTNQILDVFIIGTEIQVRKLDAKVSERDIRTTLEARMEKGAGHEAHILGTFKRETKDTAQVFATGLLPIAPSDDDSGILQRMLTPFIVIGGAVMIVYLFFTVRS
jgi:hypothetical protein